MVNDDEGAGDDARFVEPNRPRISSIVAAAGKLVEKSSAVKTQIFLLEDLDSTVLVLWAGHLSLVRHYPLK